MLKRAATFGAIATLTTGCIIIADSDNHYQPNETTSKLETFYAVAVDADAIAIRASTGGCTSKASFSTDVDRTGDNAFTVGFKRTQEDYCQALLPDGVELIYTRAELGMPQGAKVTVRNRVGG